MKKLLIACLTVVILLTSCGVTESELPSLEVRGMQIVSMLEEIAESEDYLSIYSSDEELLNIIHTFAEGDHSDPKTIYRLTLSEESVKSVPALLCASNQRKTSGFRYVSFHASCLFSG